MLSLPFDETAHSMRPARLVKITQRHGTVTRISESQQALIIPADGTYSPVAGCKLKAIKHSTGGAVPSAELQFAHFSGGVFDSNDLTEGLYDGATFEVKAVNRSDLSATPTQMFLGTIQTVDVGIDGSGSFTAKGQAATSDSFIRTYSPTCDTDLFSTLCTLNPDDFDVSATVTTIIDRYNATLTIVSPPVDFYFNDGVGETSAGQAFRIANWFQSSQQLTTYLPNTVLFTEGMSITLWPGCDKLGSTCLNKFNNRPNFQGFDHYLGALAATVTA